MAPRPAPTVPAPDAADLPRWEDVGVVDLNAQGQGVGRHEGQVVFIPYTVPGEIIDVQVIAKRPSFSIGSMANLRLPSPTRVNAQCRHFYECGGCQYQHIAYPAQPEIAAASVIGNMRKLMKGWELPEPVLLASPSGYGYRTQTRLQFRQIAGGERIPGYVGDDGEVFQVAECPILHPQLEALLQVILAWLPTPPAQAQLEALDMRFLTLQCNADGTEVAALFHTFELVNLKQQFDRDIWGTAWESWREALPACCGVVIDNGQVDVGFGQNYTAEYQSLAPLVPLGAFKQSNAGLEQSLYAQAIQWIQPVDGETGYDLYCGRGELSARLAHAAPNVQVTGVESAPIWFERRRHINQAGLPADLRSRVQFVQHTVEQWLPDSAAADWAVFNPPRKGFEPSLIDWLSQARLSRWVYISCNPATFARDCQSLGEVYRLTNLAILDMFPQTAKMELIARFELR